MGLSRAARRRVEVSLFVQPVERLEPRRLLSTAAFLSPVNTTFPAAVVTTSSADLNGDGIPDMVVAYTNGTEQVFLGTSSGQFTGGQVINTGGTLEALGHFTSSGRLDLATSAGIYQGNGNGTFSATPITGLTIPSNTIALSAADVRSTGVTDLVASIFTPAAGGSLASLSVGVLLGNGDGTFGAPILTDLGAAAGLSAQYAKSFVFGDFGGSTGHLDLVSPFGISLGAGNGTFSAPSTLPGTSAPTAPVIADGDFNGDGNLDLAIEPTGGVGVGSGNIQILLGTGGNTFTVGSTINVGGEVDSLTAADVNGDGIADLIAGTGDSGANPEVAVLLDNGTGTFQTPVAVGTSGVPTQIFTGDFNGDGKNDILALNAGSGVNPGTTLTTTSTAGVLINNSTVPVTATVTVKSSANPTVVGVPVQFTATVAGPTSAAADPTGIVKFYDATTLLGTGTLSSTGVATLTISTLAAGQHAISANYGGDGNYNAANSASLTERVLQTSAKTPLITPAIPTLTIPAVAIAGDKGTVDLTVTNVGGAEANGKVAAAFYLSEDGQIDSSSVPIAVKPAGKLSVHLGIGGAVTTALKFTVPTLSAGTYAVLVQLTPVSGLTSDQVLDTVAASPTTFQSLGYAFGTVGTHKNIKTTAVDATGDTAVLSITGPGTGVVASSGQSTSITVTGTTAASAIAITSKSGTFTFDALTDSGSLKSLNARSAADSGTLTIGAGANVSISLGLGNGCSLVSAAPITTLTLGNYSGGEIVAPSIGMLNVTGTITGNVFTHGGSLGPAKIGNITAGTWAIASNLNSLTVKGSISGAQILAGADAGPDNILGTSDDVYSAATIGTVTIDGADSSSTIGAGAVPASGSYTLLPGSAIRGITVKGPVDAGSRFASFTLPATAILSGTKIATASDPHFLT